MNCFCPQKYSNSLKLAIVRIQMSSLSFSLSNGIISNLAPILTCFSWVGLRGPHWLSNWSLHLIVPSYIGIRRNVQERYCRTSCQPMCLINLGTNNSHWSMNKRVKGLSQNTCLRATTIRDILKQKSLEIRDSPGALWGDMYESHGTLGTHLGHSHETVLKPQ